jgi:hypothetical protein
MNGRKAKKLRRAIYGEDSLKAARRYLRTPEGVVNIGLRASYQFRKEAEKRGDIYRGLLYDVCLGRYSKQRGQIA